MHKTKFSTIQFSTIQNMLYHVALDNSTYMYFLWFPKNLHEELGVAVGSTSFTLEMPLTPLRLAPMI